MKTITIFTPTYNRAYILPVLYNSLLGQTCNDFGWLVIDDGSEDGTEDLVKKWIDEDKIDISYLKKPNGGMHTAHNLAYKTIETELNVCIDSDDHLPQNAVADILNKWNDCGDKDKVCGIIGLDADLDGNIIGTPIPRHLAKGTLGELYSHYKVRGDKKVVLRTDIVKDYPPYPEYEGERLVPLAALYIMIDNDYKFIYSNQVYCIVDYQIDGSSNTIYKQYLQSPRGFAYYRTIQKKYSDSFFQNCKNSIHIGISFLATGDKSVLSLKPKVWMNYLFFPCALILFVWIKFKAR